MVSKTQLQKDLESDDFLKGVENAFWELDSVIGSRVFVWIFDPDTHSYLMELECSLYGDQPIRGWFVDPVSRKCELHAWPQGNHVFEGWVKFKSDPAFICWDQDRGAIDIGGHTDWRSRAAWKTGNQIVSYLDFIRRLLHIPENGYLRTPNRLILPNELFNNILSTLKVRSDGRRESAAILIGKVEDSLDWIADDVRFHHELCNDKAGSHYLEISEKAKFDLYTELAKTGKEIVALIHTHPKDWVGLSLIDQENQISSRIGFWSLVVPWYGREPWSIEKIGFHVRGRIGWNQLTVPETSSRFVLT